MNIFETIGIGYVILATAVFTFEFIYCAIKGVNNLRHYVARGQGGEEKRGSGAAGESNKRHVMKMSS